MKHLVSMCAVLIVLPAMANAAYAQQGKGQGKGAGQGDCCTPGAVLTEQEAEEIVYMREEEKLARDVYLAMNELWNVKIFSNISEAEQRHMDALKKLIECYDLEDPVTDDTPGEFTNPVFTQLYDELVQEGSGSLLSALMVGALIEELDIVDLQDALEEAENPDVLHVFGNLVRGSRNHLRSFARQITSAGGTYEAQHLTQEEFDEIANSPMERGKGQGKGQGQGAGRSKKGAARGSGVRGGSGKGVQQRLRDGSCGQ